jgi:hypothetical protein
MLPITITRALAKLHTALWIFLISVLAIHAEAQTWALSIEPSFCAAKIRLPIDGSSRTILVPSSLVDGQIEPFTIDQKKSLDISLGEIRTEALKTASAVFSDIRPKFIRDKKEVIQYAVLESSHPLTASCVLAPEFASKFRDTLGPNLLVAMPNRNLVLVFSRQDTTHLKLAEFIINAYQQAVWPVSREVFALENGTLRSLGVLQ